MNVRLRPAGADDKEFARGVHHEAFRDVVLRQFGRFGDEQDTFFDADWDSQPKQIIEVDDEPAGYAQIVDDVDSFEVKQIVIAPAFQNRGAGTRIMSDVIERARARGRPVRLGVLFENHDARRLYERLGFRDIGRSDTHTLMEWRTAPS
jgi:ribosomal protein S18 acetylase RimI-like enzyme